MPSPLKTNLPNISKPTAILALTFLGTHPAFAKADPPPSTLIFVGGSAGQLPSPTLDNLDRRLQQADPVSTYVLFTGNYARHGEMPGKSHPDRASVEADVRAHTDAVRAFERSPPAADGFCFCRAIATMPAAAAKACVACAGSSIGSYRPARTNRPTKSMGMPCPTPTVVTLR